jgi:hypothetical protein
MNERLPVATTPFEQTYSELCELAAKATEGGMWFSMHDGEDRVPAVRIYQYSHPTTPAYSLKGNQRKPPKTRVHHYNSWDHQTPNEVSQVSLEVSIGASATRPPHTNELTLIQLSNAFIDRAATPTELNHISQSALQELADQLPLSGTEANSLAARIVFKAIDLQGPEPINYFNGLTRKHRSYERIRNGLGTALGMILAWQPGTKGILSGIPYYARELDRSAVVDALTSFDDAGLIGQTFWQRYAQRATVTSPQTHPFIRSKLDAGELPDLLRVDTLTAKAKKESAQSDYMTRVLNQYATDPHRNQDTIHKMFGHVLTKGTVNIHQTIHFSNLVMDRIRGESPANILNPRLNANILPAFMRCLWITRRMDAPASVRAGQLEQDILHTELLAVLQSEQPHRRTERALAAIALQHPRASTEQMAQARTKLQKKQPLAEIVKLFGQ